MALDRGLLLEIFLLGTSCLKGDIFSNGEEIGDLNSDEILTEAYVLLSSALPDL